MTRKSRMTDCPDVASGMTRPSGTRPGGTENDRSTPSTNAWHIPAAVLAAYAAEGISEADAWSAESHLARCGQCRADLAALAGAGALHRDVLSARDAVMTRIDGSEPVLAAPRASARASAPWARPALVLRGPWVTAVIVAVLVAAVAELLTSHAVGVFGHVPTVGLLGPLVPLAGVGLCYRATDRGWAEAVLATPSAGLRLVLWRVLTVLVIAVPITVVVAAIDHRTGPVTWLLPALGLAAGSLALGTRLELGRATGIVAALWAAVVAAPTFMTQHLLIDVFSGAAQGIWAVALAVCLAALIVRRARFGQLPAWRPDSTGQER